MSRSYGAWTKSWAAARAAVRGAGGSGRRRVRLPSTAAPFTCPRWSVAIALLVLALAPAPAPARPSQAGAVRSPTVDARRQPRRDNNRQPARPRAGGPSATKRLAGAGLLATGAGYGGSGGSPLVRLLQRRLAAVGDPPGPIDGLYGPLTENAVAHFQAAHGLLVDGIAGPVTLAALTAPVPVLYPGAGYPQAHGSVTVRILQRALARLGFAPGPIDGRYGPLTTQAVTRFQRAHGLQVDGIAGARTWQALDTATHRASAAQPERRTPPATPPARKTPTPKPTHTRAPTAPSPPVEQVVLGLLALALLGLLMMLVGYAKTRHQVRRAQSRHAQVDTASREVVAAHREEEP
jgi:peptidoglycan hydrolase-like protein with peptidoglycan-binding domain